MQEQIKLKNYNGTNGGSGPNINTGRACLINAGAGNGTAALICGGFKDHIWNTN